MHAKDESAASGKPIPTGKRDRLRGQREEPLLGQRDRLRCQLVPVPPIVENWRWRNKVKPTAPPLVLDVGTNGAIRVIDANTNALIASDWLAGVTVTPAKWKRYADENNEGYTQPLVIVDVPGLQPLRIGARSTDKSSWSGVQFRYVWSGMVGGADQPAYAVTEADWLTLVEKLGLGTCVVDDYASGTMARRDRRKMVMFFAETVLILVVLAVAAYLAYGR